MLKRLMVLVGLTSAYFVAATLGLRLAYVNPSATAVWPGTGIALAAFLILDLDGLKVINDRYGHLVGSRALKRVAEALRFLSRAMDKAVRFGGDEFALVLPETSEIVARQVARRVCERLVNDRELPPITVSVGVAEYPRDGNTAESLIGAADRRLYDVKGRSAGGVPVGH